MRLIPRALVVLCVAGAMMLWSAPIQAAMSDRLIDLLFVDVPVRDRKYAPGALLRSMRVRHWSLHRQQACGLVTAPIGDKQEEQRLL